MDTCPVQVAPAAVARTRAARRPLIAVVDDDPAVVRSLEFVLDAEGYRVAAFASAQSFLQSAPRGIDCLVVDVRLPGMDGIQLLEALGRRGSPPPPRILIASNPSRRCRQWATEAAVPLVEKPFLDEMLTDRIQAAVADRTPRRVKS